MKLSQNKILFLIVISIIGFFIIFDSNLLKSTSSGIKLILILVWFGVFGALTMTFDEREEKATTKKMWKQFWKRDFERKELEKRDKEDETNK